MSEKKVLVLGAGSVSRPCVQYLLGNGYQVTVVDISEENIKRSIAQHPNGTPIVGNAVNNTAEYIRLYRPDIVICLLPAAFMIQTAKTCLAEGVSMIGASYVSDVLKTLHVEAKKKGVKILCEMGVDPGIDHMSAVAKIREIQAAGGIVTGFWSLCGALPDLGSNTNPLGYKLSWAPASLIGASLRSAKIMENGKVIDLPDGKTYQRPSFVEIKGLGWFESYPNANSLPYIEAYGLPEIETIYRGTLRYPGWCDMITQMQRMSLFDETKRSFSGQTYASLMKELTGCKNKNESAQECVANFLHLKPYSTVVEKLGWLGIFNETPITPANGSLRDVISDLYTKKLIFSPGEYDLVVMQHKFDISYPQNGKRERITSTMIDRGCVDKDTAIARTTGLPIGIAAHLVLNGMVRGEGVLIPTTEDIYRPALKALKREGISFTEHKETF